MADEDRATERLTKRSCYIDDDQWSSADRAAAIVRARTGRPVTRSDLIRWGLHRQIQAIADGDMEPPEGFETSEGG